MTYEYLIIDWIFGVFCLFIGIILGFIDSPLTGFGLIVAAGLFLPPVRGFVYSKTNISLPTMARVVFVLALFIMVSIFSGQASDKRAAQLRQQNIDCFNTNRDQIISSAKKALSEKRYQSVIAQSEKYLDYGDEELEQMNVQANSELLAIQKAIQKAKKTEKILAELKGVPTEEYEKNNHLYGLLLYLNPDNELYKSKVAFYAGKVEKKQLRDSLFGDLTKAKIKKRKGKKYLMVWGPHIIYSRTLPNEIIRSVMLEGVQELEVEYDEIWRVTEPEMHRLTLYWKNNLIQAATVENHYISDPSTGWNLSTPSYKLDNIYNRSYILNKLSEQ